MSAVNASDGQRIGSGSSFRLDRATRMDVKHKSAPALKSKDLIGLPWLLAFALRADGWWLRSEITWCKRAPMPESVTDRPTSATEKIFLFSKSARYFFDTEAVRETSESEPGERNLNYAGRGTAKGYVPEPGRDSESAQSRHGNALEATAPRGSRNMRNFWLLGPDPYADAHFATFPSELPKRCILAGTSAKGVCHDCGAPWLRIVERCAPDIDHQKACGGNENGNYFGKATKDFENAKAQNASDVKARILRGMVERKTTGWVRGCKCAGDPVPATVLDPFLGSGTTAAVAIELGRRAVGIELNPEYVKLAEQRCAAVTPGLAIF